MNERNKVLNICNKDIEVYKNQDDAIVDIVEYALATPNGHTLITAPTLNELQMYIKPQIVDLLVGNESVKTNYAYQIILTNGHIITMYPVTRDIYMGSLNLTSFCMLGFRAEDIFTTLYLISRLRNKATDNYLTIIA